MDMFRIFSDESHWSDAGSSPWSNFDVCCLRDMQGTFNWSAYCFIYTEVTWAFFFGSRRLPAETKTLQISCAVTEPSLMLRVTSIVVSCCALELDVDLLLLLQDRLRLFQEAINNRLHQVPPSARRMMEPHQPLHPPSDPRRLCLFHSPHPVHLLLLGSQALHRVLSMRTEGIWSCFITKFTSVASSHSRWSSRTETDW